MKIGIIGAGHNGLVCASYLAQAGHMVTIFEARSLAGGLCVTEELLPGYKISSVASYFGMLRKEIMAELELTKYGLEPYLTDPVEIVLLDKDKYTYTPRDSSTAQIKVGELKGEDLEGWHLFWQDMGKAAALISPHYLRPGLTKGKACRLLEENGLNRISEYLFAGNLLELLKTYTQNPYFHAAAATCTPGFANMPGSVYGCIHHGTAITCGEDGAWGQVKGGMGQVSQALLARARSLNVDVRLNSPVSRIIVENNIAAGIALQNGEEHYFDCLISNADPVSTFGLSKNPAAGLSGLSGSNAGSAGNDTNVPGSNASISPVSAAKIHFGLKSLPVFPLLEAIGHNYQGVIVLAPPIESVIEASRLVPQGHMPSRLMLTMAFPSTSDETAAPAGKHLLTVDVHYVPANPGGQPWQESDTKQLVEKTIADIEIYSPAFSQHIEGIAAITPKELKDTYGVSTASCWHLPMGENYLLEDRCLPGYKGYETDIQSLYLCGSGTYPSGNVTGAPGYNCAREIISRHARVY